MKEAAKFKRGNIILISLTHHLHDIYSSFLAPLRPLLIEKFELTYSLSALWDIIIRIPWFLNPLFGIIAEKTAARYIVIFTPAVTAIAMSLLGVAPTFAAISILLFVAGISSGMFHVPTPVMVQQLSGKFVGKGMSYYMFGGEMARTIAPLVITGAISLWGLEGIWKLFPFGIVASLVLYYRLKDIHITQNIKKEKKTGIWKAFVRLLPFFAILIGITFFRAIMKVGLTNFIPTYYYTEKGDTYFFANSALSVFQFAGAIGALFSGTLSDRIGRKRSLLIIASITPLLLLAFVETSGLLSFFFLIVLGFFIVAPTPILLALVQDREKENKVFANSIYMTISFVTSAISVYFAGAIGDRVGLENAYRIAAFIAFGAVPFVLMLKTRD